MNFNVDGYLNAGLHSSNLADIKTHFVDNFPATSTRLTVYDGYKNHSAQLVTFGVDFNQFLDGSFVSSKENPGDIDVLTMADHAKVNALSPVEQVRLRQLFLGKGSKPQYQCDSFFLTSFPDTDPAYQHYREQRKYWMGEFGFDRVDKPKGILTVDVLAAPPPAAPTPTSPPVTP